MPTDGWHVTEAVDDFLARAGDFLRSRPARHTMMLTRFEKLRTGEADGTVFGRLESAGEVHAVYHRHPSRLLHVSTLSPAQADTLAAQLTGPLMGVSADEDTATAFAEAWQRHTGATPALLARTHLYRLGTLTPPEPRPQGRGRVAGAQDRDRVIRWCGEFVAAVGEAAVSWAASRFADKHFMFWESLDGTPVSLAGWTPVVGGMVRVDPVYTPADLRGRGYAGAVTVEVSRAALAAGATDVVLFADPANPTSNALYQRLGYVPVADFAVYEFSSDTS